MPTAPAMALVTGLRLINCSNTKNNAKAPAITTDRTVCLLIEKVTTNASEGVIDSIIPNQPPTPASSDCLSKDAVPFSDLSPRRFAAAWLAEVAGLLGSPFALDLSN